MRFAPCVSVVALLLAATLSQPAHAESARTLINRAIAAQGGLAALRALRALSIAANAMYWDPGQSKVAGGEPRFLGNTTLTVTWDLANGMARTEWDRDMKYPAVEKIKYTEIITPSLGYITDEKASRPASGIRVATALRELERASPTLLLKGLGREDRGAAPGKCEVRQPAVARHRLPAWRDRFHHPARSRNPASGRGAHARRR